MGAWRKVLVSLEKRGRQQRSSSSGIGRVVAAGQKLILYLAALYPPFELLLSLSNWVPSPE